MREILFLLLVSVEEQAGLNLILSETPKTGFLALLPIYGTAIHLFDKYHHLMTHLLTDLKGTAALKGNESEMHTLIKPCNLSQT